MSTYRSPVTSWRIRSIGNSGARSSGPTGCSVPGCSGGGGGLGRSGTTLYHCVGSCDSSSRILCCAVPAMAFPPPRVAASVDPLVGVEGGVELAPSALPLDHLERAADAVATEQQPVPSRELHRLDQRAVG